MEKIFVIGCNKTGTSFFHSRFLAHGLKSQHNTCWNLNAYDCFSDGGDLQDIKYLDKTFPKAIFILNTRPLFDWLVSRVTHGYKYRQNWSHPFSHEKCLSWIKLREKHHLFTLDFFKKNKDHFYICDISKKENITETLDLLGIKSNDIKPRHKNSSFTISKEHLDIIYDCFSDLKYSVESQKTTLVKSLEQTNVYLDFYKK